MEDYAKEKVERRDESFLQAIDIKSVFTLGKYSKGVWG